jgi:2-oxoglutarate dehydrogenase E1 component
MKKAVAVDFDASPSTAIDDAQFKALFEAIMLIPEGFKPLKKIEKLLQDKHGLLQKENKVDWATGELLAYASLLADGKEVRMKVGMMY